jgi:uncharacterized RDD family membrane protein YckC
VPAVVIGSVLPLIGGILVWFFYAPVLESSAIRATIGKYLLGIQVSDLAGHRLSLKAATIRNLLKIISTVLLFIGFFVAMFTRRRQSVHDLIADSVVVYGRSEVAVADAWVDSAKSVFGATGISVGRAPSIAELERLAALREKGALNEEEYQAAKAKILNSL